MQGGFSYPSNGKKRWVGDRRRQIRYNCRWQKGGSIRVLKWREEGRTGERDISFKWDMFPSPCRWLSSGGVVSVAGLWYLYLSWLFVCFRWLAAINLVIIIICFNVNAFKISENSINNKTTCSCVLLMSYHEILHISFRSEKPKTRTCRSRKVAKSR